jgi:hypothetical protein
MRVGLVALFLTASVVAFGPRPLDAAEPLPATAHKTLVAWVTLDNLTQRGGSALTVQVGEEFDAIVFGERAAGK